MRNCWVPLSVRASKLSNIRVNRKDQKHSNLFGTVDWQNVNQINWNISHVFLKDVPICMQTDRVICSLSDLLSQRSPVARFSCCCVSWSWASTLLKPKNRINFSENLSSVGKEKDNNWEFYKLPIACLCNDSPTHYMRPFFADCGSRFFNSLIKSTFLSVKGYCVYR